LSHALWLLVILKLLTPPLWGVQIDRRWARAIEPVTTEPSRVSAAPSLGTPSEPVAQVSPRIEFSEGVSGDAEVQLGYTEERSTLPAPAVEAPAAIRSQDMTAALWAWLPAAATLVWSIGSMICAGLIVVRVVRFHRLLRFATLASPALQGRAAALARRMGMSRAPRVWFVPGAVSPMLWPLGRGPRMLIPSELWSRLGEGQRLSLLAHELAHLRRRDHWVRLPEVLASVLYWWCPLTWYARRRLREAEEQCCDAWVVWAFPDAARDYASALLETVDFVTAGGRLPLPVLASGMGQFHQLKRRLVMIKHARVSRNLSGPGWLAVGVLALGILPLAPTLAQVSVSAAGPAESKNAPAGVIGIAPAPVEAAPGATETAVTSVRVGSTSSATVAEAPAAPDDPDGSIINELKTKPLLKNEVSIRFKSDEDGGVDARLDAARHQVRELTVELKRAQQRLADLEMAASRKGDSNYKPMKALPKEEVLTPPVAPGAPGYPSLKKGAYDRRALGGYESGKSGVGMLPPPGDSDLCEKRLNAIEANLKALLQEVHSMREKPQPTPEGSQKPR